MAIARSAIGTWMKNRNHAGFTLIEILIVMLIISIVSGVALLSVHDNPDARMRTLAKELVNAFNLAQTEAMLEPAVLGFNNTASSYEFYRYAENDTKHPWHAMTEPVFAKHAIPRGFKLQIKIQNHAASATDEADTENPNLIISSSGDMTPFIILIGKQDEAPRYQITGSGNGSLQIAKTS